jgi:hypothetical protein
MTLLIIWLVCLGFNIIATLIDALIISKEFKITIGEILIVIIFMIILSPMGTLVYLITFLAKYNDKTIVDWKRK